MTGSQKDVMMMTMAAAMMMMLWLTTIRNLSNLSSRWIHQIKRVWDDDKSLQVQWGCSSLHTGINRDLNHTGHTEFQHEVVQLSERCPIYNGLWRNGMKAYICFNSGMHRT